MNSEDNWQLIYEKINNQMTVSLVGGLSAQICMAKYIAFQRKILFGGYQCKVPKLSQNQQFIQKTLSFLYKEYRSHKNVGKVALYSPGICSVPYLVETCNMMYLPSHFLVGVRSLEKLQSILNYANQKGYQCYAVVGYDSCLGDWLCAWIKFIQLPKEYVNLIKEFHIEKVVIMAANNLQNKTQQGQRLARLCSFRKSTQKGSELPCPGDIFILFINQSYGGNCHSDIKIFKKYLRDTNQQLLDQLHCRPIVKSIQDWQSGIDCIARIQLSLKQQIKDIKCMYIVSKDSWQLYKIAYYVGKKFIQYNYDAEINAQKIEGVVFNQYFINNPTYELGYGWVPVLYWQFYPKNQQRITKLLNQNPDQKMLYLKRWFNKHRTTKIQLIQKNSFVIQMDDECRQLINWITKYVKTSYDYVRYLPIQTLIEIVRKMDVAYVFQKDDKKFIKLQTNQYL